MNFGRIRWSDSTTLAFVKLYRKYECLWKWNRDSGTRNPVVKKGARKQALHNLATEFQALVNIALPVEEVEKKIKSLRSTYSQEVKKIKEKSTPDYEYKPTLIWFEEMHECVKSCGGYSGTPNDGNTSSSSGQVWIPQDPKVELTAENSDPEYFNYDSNSESESENSETAPPKRKMKRKKVVKTTLPDSNWEHTTTCNSFSQGLVKEDEFDIYGKFVASQLRSMELQRALRLQLEIQNLISNARISDLNMEHQT